MQVIIMGYYHLIIPTPPLSPGNVRGNLVL